MAIFRNRIASKQDLFLVFSACVLPIFMWSIFNVLREVPAWILRLNNWDLIGMIAYTQVFALIESVMVFLAMVLLGVVLPIRFFKYKFVVQASVIIFVSAAWAVIAQINRESFDSGSLRLLAVGLVAYLITLGGAYALVHRYKKVEQLIKSVVNRITVLSTFFIVVGILSLAIVILRNL